jgi:uncharacterized protein YdeI (YjbR/CyaY-like superfamily)
MPKNPKVDAYIEKSREFAQPIMKKIRALYHKACPKIEEEIKWGFPCFVHKGIVGNMAAFKEHVAIGFWKGSLLDDPRGYFKGAGDGGISNLKLKTVKDLPGDKEMIAFIKQAVKLNEEGVKPEKSAKKKAELKEPAYMTAAIRKNKDAAGHWKAFTPAKKREYIEWVTGAKQEATRDKRLKQAIEWISEGKPRNWKYMNC